MNDRNEYYVAMSGGEWLFRYTVWSGTPESYPHNRVMGVYMTKRGAIHAMNRFYRNAGHVVARTSVEPVEDVTP